MRWTVRPPRLATLFALAFAAGGWHAGLSQLSDNSFFCHLRTGQWIVEHGIPHRDIYSFVAAGTPWVSESWLAELLYGVIDRLFGPLGLRVLTAFTSAGIAVMAYQLALGLAHDRVRAVLLSLIALGTSFTLWSARPLLLGLVTFVALTWIVEAEQSGLGRHPLLSIAPVIWLWANIHGTFALGLIYLVLHCLGRWLDGFPPWRSRERQLCVAGAIGFALCFINPYGAKLVIAPLHLLARKDLLRAVVEWKPVDFRNPTDFRTSLYFTWLLTFIACMVVERGRLARRDLLVSAPFLLLGLWAQRNIVLAPMVTLPVAARAIAKTSERAEPGLKLNWAIAASIVVLVIRWTAAAVERPNFDFEGYPAAAMQTLAAKGLLGRRLLSTDAWNGFIILRWWPRQYIFMDDRYDIYPSAVAMALKDLSQGQGGWRQMLATYRIEVVVWPLRPAMLKALEAEQGWIEVYRDATAAVFAKKTLLDDLLHTGLGKPPQSADRCGG